MRGLMILMMTTALAALPMAAHAQAAAQAEEGDSDIVVTATRLGETIADFPGSSTVVGAAQLESQLATTRDLGSVLAFSVPGLSASSNTAANVEQGLRGRPLRIFVDGVPVSNPLRDGGRDLRLIAPTAIGAIEVIRGASAIYGQGGAGGIINYVTKRGKAGDAWTFRTEAGLGFSTQNVGDSLNPMILQSGSGAIGDFDITFAGSYERVNGQFDAEGDRLPPDPQNFGGIADSDIWNFFGKVGYNFGGQRLEAMFNYYDQHQRSDFIPTGGNVALGQKVRAVRGSYDPRAIDPINRNVMGYLAYFNDNLLGTFHAQLYHLSSYSVFSFNAARLGGTQTTINSKKTGLQADFKTQFDALGLGDGYFLWGVDIARDTTEQPLIPLTDKPGDGRTFTPPLKQMNYAAFIQIDKPITPWLSLNAGIRHDEFTLDIDDFVAGLTNVHVAGGKLKYSATPVNVGLTARVGPELELFGGFSQGFSIPDIGSPLRSVVAPNLNGFRPEPQLVNNYEIGVRGKIAGISYSAAYYISTADFGTDFVIDTVNPTEALTLREKEKVQGWEVSLSGTIATSTRWMANYSHNQGRRDANKDGKLDTPLTNRRIGPDQFNLAVDHDITTDWSVRLQYNHSGSRNAFPGSAAGNFYTGRIRPTDRIDLSTKFKADPFDVSVGVNNLLNEDYFSVSAQLINRNELYTKAEGRTVYVKLGVNY
ncbi:TonB-dependent receptor [Sphingomonas colocasiae]|uniref:TonB-dependent receptor n=1 Tax=Sphingomonas colocasiae TaxID=1848973 RepID=A0ABS7PU69_9SPHN|nr:TonB-dependent receptor [Sphingomonas colocasiae]MBY8824220.1 TonB-dependent receptor [Sphingomonas colocasiae]